MRTQITVYIDKELKVWLAKYARRLHLKESEIIRLLICREQKARWVKRAIAAPDPEGDAASNISTLRRTARRA